MKRPQIIIIILLTIFFSCSDNGNKFEKVADVFSENNFGISIENGLRQGFKDFDSLGTEFFYLCKTTTITNDTTVPVDLKIYFSKEYNYLRSNMGLMSNVFLLPQELTTEDHELNTYIPEELKKFLKSSIASSITFNKTLSPQQKCMVTIAVVTNTKYKVPMYFGLKLKTDKLTGKGQTLPIVLYLDNPYVIPCGQISF